MKSVRDGELNNLGLLFERHSKRLYNYFLRRIKDRAKSEDLVQNVFYNILKYRHTYKDTYNFKVWMYRIARNENINYFKNKPLLAGTNCTDPDEVIDSDHNPENDLEHKRALNFLEAALARISPDKKELILLSRVDGLRYDQISEIVGCSIGAVKVRMYRAIRELTKCYLEITGGARDGL